MIRLDKRLVDEVIRLTEMYFETNDTDYIDALFEAKYALKEKATWTAAELLIDLAKYTQVSGNGTYEDIYKALAVFGIIVEELNGNE